MTDQATPAKVRLTDGLGALMARLTACAEDPVWAEHAEVPKALLRKAAEALEETAEIAEHYMAQRDEERARMARAVTALGIGAQCIHAAYSEHWASFDSLSDDFDDAMAEVMSGAGAVAVTPATMRQAVAQCEIELGGEWCETCPTVDACRIRGRCSPFLGKHESA
jgi:hypothetical protein